MGPLLADEGPRRARVRRRLKGIAVEAGAFAATTATLPLLLACAAGIDVALWLLRRKP